MYCMCVWCIQCEYVCVFGVYNVHIFPQTDQTPLKKNIIGIKFIDLQSSEANPLIYIFQCSHKTKYFKQLFFPLVNVRGKSDLYYLLAYKTLMNVE